VLDPRRYGAPAGTRDLEGFLFPATYELTAGAPAVRLVEDQLAAFRERFTSDDVRRARALGVTPYQLLTVASMIEREAQTSADRPRSRRSSTTACATACRWGSTRRSTTPSRSRRDRDVHRGTDGVAAANRLAVQHAHAQRAAADADLKSRRRVDRSRRASSPRPLLYYVAGADGCGEQVFSRTAAKFEKNVAAYDAAVKKNGGKPPVCKKK